MCIGITRKTKDVLIHPNVKILCNKCMQGETSTKMKSLNNQNNKPSTGKSPQTTAKRQSNMYEFTSPSNDKLDAMLTLLQSVSSTVKDTNEKVSSHFETSKSYSDVLKQIKEVTTSTNVKLDASKQNPYPAATEAGKGGRSLNSLKAFPGLNVHTPKRRREEVDVTPKPNFKGRSLKSGTGATADHGLGEAVAVNKTKKTSPFAHLTKSIYISRLQTDVTVDKITGYIKEKLPDIAEKDVLLRMLVKKDQNLSDLTFISYRLQCTEDLYDQFIESSFWPQHVMIGEFIERERERKQPDVADFVLERIAVKNRKINTENDTDGTPQKEDARMEVDTTGEK